MPHILEETVVSLERSDLKSRIPVSRPVTARGLIIEPDRTPGIHLSGVLRYVVIESGLMKTQQSALDEEDLPLRMALGLAWEEYAASFFPDMNWQPGEAIADGIVMTCDGHSCVDGEFVIEEFKLTWKKAKTADELVRDEFYWMQQGRGYCWGYGANHVRWHICYVNGDYRGSGPIYKRYLIRFSDADVESTRQLVLRNVSRAIEKGYAE